MSNLRFTISPVRLGRLPSVIRRGFTFTEVLFAVMLLGIGFIMVAAIFPVAIQQSQANRDDASGIIVAKAGAKIMQSVPFVQKELAPDPGDMDNGKWEIVHPFGAKVRAYKPYSYLPQAKYSLFGKIKGNLINKSDPRYAWVPLGYKFSQPMPYPGLSVWQSSSYTVYIVSVACRTKSAYDERDINIPGSTDAAFTFQPKEVYFRLKDGGADPDTIEFCRQKTGFTAYDEPAAAEGAFVLVGDDQYHPGHPRYHDANGRIYRIGIKRTDRGIGVWELMPGYDMTNDFENIPATIGTPINNKPGIGYMVGRGYSDPSDRNSPREGPAQDLFALPVVVDMPLAN